MSATGRSLWGVGPRGEGEGVGDAGMGAQGPCHVPPGLLPASGPKVPTYSSPCARCIL